jgi:hypothetical protein
MKVSNASNAFKFNCKSLLLSDDGETHFYDKEWKTKQNKTNTFRKLTK